MFPWRSIYLHERRTALANDDFFFHYSVAKGQLFLAKARGRAKAVVQLAKTLCALFFLKETEGKATLVQLGVCHPGLIS